MRVKWVRRFSKDKQADSCSDDSSLAAPRTTSASISLLPEEILLDILLYIRNSADQLTFAHCALCCRRWHRICFPMLYSDVVLQSGSYSQDMVEIVAKKDKEKLGLRVLAFASTLSARADLVQSLTLRTASCNIDWPKRRPWMRLDRRRSEPRHWYPTLCRVLPQLPKLATFSLKIGDNAQRVLWTPHSRILEVLDILPESVVNLEVDTMGADFATAGPARVPSHICPTISRILPRLRTLRLRLRFLCTDVFECLEEDRRSDSLTGVVAAPISTLEDVLLIFTPRLGTVGSQSTLLQTRLCGTFDRPQMGETFEHMSIFCHALCASEKLPNLRSFSLIDHAAGDMGRGYKVYNAMKNESDDITYAAAVQQGLLHQDSENALFAELPILAPHGAAAADFDQLGIIAEGRGAWGDSSYRSRRPMAYEAP